MLCQTRLNIPTVCWLQDWELQIVSGGGKEFMKEIKGDMWQNILVWLCGTCSVWCLGCCCKIMWWKLTVDFVIRKTVPNSHTCSAQWLADKLQLLFWFTLHSLSIMEKLSPYVVLQVPDSTDFSQIALLKAYFVPCFLPSTDCLSLLNRYIHPTFLQNHSLSVLCGLRRKMGLCCFWHPLRIWRNSLGISPAHTDAA